VCDHAEHDPRESRVSVKDSNEYPSGPYECHGPLTDIDHQVPTDFDEFFAMHALIGDSDTRGQP
jgi:hypothetical protein